MALTLSPLKFFSALWFLLMVSKTKLYQQLDQLEQELVERLVPHLASAAEGNNPFIFCATGFNSVKAPSHKIDKVTDELVDMGAQILSLQTKLGEPSAGSPAERICWYCRKWNAVKTDQAKAARSLATQFLQEIGTV